MNHTNTLIRTPLLALTLALATAGGAWAQAKPVDHVAHHPAVAASAPAPAASGMAMGAGMGGMHHMKAMKMHMMAEMDEQCEAVMKKLVAENSPAKRAKILAEHEKAMQAHMKAMHEHMGAGGMGMMGHCDPASAPASGAKPGMGMGMGAGMGMGLSEPAAKPAPGAASQ